MKKITTYLIAIAAIMLLSFGAKAQGGTTPLVGSTHLYSVVAEDDANNTLAWSVTGGVLGTNYTINSGGATEQVSITWLLAGTYTVQFTEENATSCIATKTISVTVSANTFDVSTTDPVAICNAADGQANYSGSTATTGITIKVDMTTANTGFSPNWEFKFTLAPGTATVANVKAGATSLTPVAGIYTATGLTSTSGDGTVDITMDVTGDQYVVQTVVLEITSAKELTYNTPDVDNTDWTASQTINAIPNTSSITTD